MGVQGALLSLMIPTVRFDRGAIHVVIFTRMKWRWHHWSSRQGLFDCSVWRVCACVLRSEPECGLLKPRKNKQQGDAESTEPTAENISGRFILLTKKGVAYLGITEIDCVCRLARDDGTYRRTERHKIKYNLSVEAVPSSWPLISKDLHSSTYTCNT